MKALPLKKLLIVHTHTKYKYKIHPSQLQNVLATETAEMWQSEKNAASRLRQSVTHYGRQAREHGGLLLHNLRHTEVYSTYYPQWTGHFINRPAERAGQQVDFVLHSSCWLVMCGG